jgi:hypothetical protein
MIEPKDMVVVVRYAHEHGSCLGMIYEVRELAHGVIYCAVCGERLPSQRVVGVVLNGERPTGWLPETWVKKIPPLGELEGMEEQEREPHQDHIC